MLCDEIYETMLEAYNRCKTEGEKESIRNGCKIFSEVMYKNNVFTEREHKEILEKIKRLT